MNRFSHCSRRNDLQASRYAFSFALCAPPIAHRKIMAYITQPIAERKASVVQFIDSVTHDCPKAAPRLTIRETFESTGTTVWPQPCWKYVGRHRKLL